MRDGRTTFQASCELLLGSNELGSYLATNKVIATHRGVRGRFNTLDKHVHMCRQEDLVAPPRSALAVATYDNNTVHDGQATLPLLQENRNTTAEQ